jgi:hypothetical protein
MTWLMCLVNWKLRLMACLWHAVVSVIVCLLSVGRVVGG